MTAAKPKPTPEQQRAADPTRSVWVAASAGSGKTTVLVNRMLRLLLEGTAPQKILCITFTKAAAANILQRLQHVAKKWAIQPDKDLLDDLTTLLGSRDQVTPDHIAMARRLLARILAVPGGMNIMTIHAFCQSVLSRFPVEAGLKGGIDIADEFMAREFLARAKHDLLVGQTDDTALHDALSVLYGNLSEEAQNKIIDNIMTKRYRLGAFLQRFDHDINHAIDFVYEHIGIDPALTPQKLRHDYAETAPFDMIRAMYDTARSVSSPTNEKHTRYMADFCQESHAHLDNYLSIFVTEKNTARKIVFSGFKNMPPVLVNFIQSETTRAQALRQSLAAASLAATTTAMLRVVHAVQVRYEKIKHMNGVMDFEDQVLLTARLMSELTDTPWVLYKLDGGIDHILVDEAQDTSPAQWVIIDRIVHEFFAGDGTRNKGERSVFVVGDEKQSIYSFQNADPQSFAAMRDRFMQYAKNAGADFINEPLNCNFRSGDLVLRLVDACFDDPALRAQLTRDAHVISHVPRNNTDPARIELWPLVPQTDGGPSPDTILARHIARYIKNIMETDKTVSYRDFMILVRKRHPMVTPLTKALKDLNIPVANTDRLVMAEQMAVRDCLAALHVALGMADDYTFACFLRSPFVRLSDADLYALCRERGEAKLRDSTLPEPVAAYVKQLQEYARNYGPTAFFTALLSDHCPRDTRGGRHALVRALGYDTDDNLNRFLEMAKQFEQTHTCDLTLFLGWMRNNTAQTKNEGHSKNNNSVSIMTVHASKGLESRFVILADANGKPSSYKSNEDVLWHENEQYGFYWANAVGTSHPEFILQKNHKLTMDFAEYYRLLYVALTRAEHTLVVCGHEHAYTRHADFDHWYDIINRGFSRVAQTGQFIQSEENHNGQLIKILERKGLYKHDTQKDKINLRNIDDMLRIKPPQEKSALRPLRPSQPHSTKEAEPAARSPLETGEGFTFKRGVLLHRIFRVAPDHAPELQDDLIDHMLSQHDLPPYQKEQIKSEALTVLRHPDFAFLFTPNARAEVPVVGEAIYDGQRVAISGQIDRLYVSDTHVLIVDYKTNRPPAKTEDDVPVHYRNQLRAYKALMEKIYPERTVLCALLWTADAYLLPVSV